MILDTAFVVDVLRGEPSVADAVDTIDDRGVASVSTVTIMELWEGIHRSTASERERERIERFLSDVREVPFDRESAMRAGELNALLAADGVAIEVADVMIAATALCHDVPVVTGNVDHFERIGGLDVLTY